MSPAAGRPDTKSDTKQRILEIAGELFARQGYTATTIADIARELGTTTAALYYHFPSKAAILGGLMARPLTAYLTLLDGLDSGAATPEDLLGSLIDITAESRDLATIFDRDPAALAIIDEQLPRPSRELTEQTIAVLAAPAPTTRRSSAPAPRSPSPRPPRSPRSISAGARCPPPTARRCSP